MPWKSLDGRKKSVGVRTVKEHCYRRCKLAGASGKSSSCSTPSGLPHFRPCISKWAGRQAWRHLHPTWPGPWEGRLPPLSATQGLKRDTEKKVQGGSKGVRGGQGVMLPSLATGSARQSRELSC